MHQRDYYEILNVDRNADDTTIKKAFRSLALQYHPDRNPSPEATEKFKEAQEAYSILSDSQKRGFYDQFGHAGVSGSASQAATMSMEDIFGSFQNMFEDFFGASRPHHGPDLLYRLPLTFKEAILGCTKQVNIKRSEVCASCKGSGCAPGTRPESCKTCRGRGKVSKNQGFFIISQTCPTCNGQRQVIRNICRHCQGHGQIKEEKKIEVKVPAGIDAGMRLRISQEGELNDPQGARGDLYVEIEVETDLIFERDGLDLYAKVYVPYPVAVLGGDVEVPLLEGSATVSIPAEMQPPYKISLKNEGIKDLRRNRRGNLIIEAHIETPKNLTSHAKELIQELKAEFQKLESTSHKKTDKKKRFFDFS